MTIMEKERFQETAQRLILLHGVSTTNDLPAVIKTTTIRESGNILRMNHGMTKAMRADPIEGDMMKGTSRMEERGKRSCYSFDLGRVWARVLGSLALPE